MTSRPVLTIDFEEWFHVCGHPVYAEPLHWARFEQRVHETAQILLSILEAGGAKATFFVLGWVARNHPALIRRISAAGHEIACHGDLHRRVFDMTHTEFREDLRRSKLTLEDLCSRPVTAFRAPEWSVRTPANPAFEILVEEGFTIDSSLLGVPPVGPRDLPRTPFVIETPGGSLLEIPPLAGTFLKIPAMMGGGWTSRISREARVVKAIEKALERGEFPLLYFHPWEFDPAHPRMELDFIPRLVHFAGTSRVPGRLARLLGRFSFVTLLEAGALLHPQKRPDAEGVAA